MNTPQQEDRLQKIRALLAKAEGTNHPAEAQAFSAKAQELMAKWAIDDAMLDASQDKPGNIIKHTVWLDANEYRAPKIRLLADLAALNDCKSVMHRQTYREIDGVRKRQFEFVLVGHEKDVENVETLYTSFLTQAGMAYLNPTVQADVEAECEQGGHRIKWRNTFMMSFASEIRRILSAAKERVKAEAATGYAPGSMAMVFVGRAALVERKLAEFYPNLCKSARTSAGQGSGAAMGHGRQAARNADTGRPKLGGNRKQLS